MPLFIAVVFCTSTSLAQETITVDRFQKIIASPRVNVILEKGDKESVRILYNQIPKNKVNVKVKGKTLHIYLDHARMVEKQRKITINGDSHKQGIYAYSSITAYVTYVELKGVQMRGEEELRSDTPITTEKFKLKAYGESEITLAAVNARRLKVALYGENDLKIKSGKIVKTKYKLFGTNRIDATGVDAETIASRIYGEGTLRVNASDVFKYSAMGEPTIQVLGRAHVHKGIVLGRMHVTQ